MITHEVWSVTGIENRVCGECEDIHFYDDHIADLRWLRMRCGEKGCKCREFACYEHPDNSCGDEE